MKSSKIPKWLNANKLTLIFLLVLVWGGYFVIGWAVNPNFSPGWTGFGEYTNSAGEIERAKTLWDWLNLLIVPFLVAIVVWLLNKAEKANENKLADLRSKTEQSIAQEKIHEEAVQLYLDKMTDLILDEGLRSSKEKSEIRSIARSRTLTVLRGLDGSRKGLLLQFLYETGFIIHKPIIELVGANLSCAIIRRANFTNANFDYSRLDQADLSFARFVNAHLYNVRLSKSILYQTDFSSANLHLANINEANLEMSNLAEADLSDAELKKSILRSAYLIRTNLRGANLQGASLAKADLTNADLTRADLTGADLTNAKLTGARLQGTILINTNLRGAVLNGADLSLADLSHAKVKGHQLASVKSLDAAIMMNGKPYRGEKYA